MFHKMEYYSKMEIKTLEILYDLHFLSTDEESNLSAISSENPVYHSRHFTYQQGIGIHCKSFHTYFSCLLCKTHFNSKRNYCFVFQCVFRLSAQ